MSTLLLNDPMQQCQCIAITTDSSFLGFCLIHQIPSAGGLLQSLGTDAPSIFGKIGEMPTTYCALCQFEKKASQHCVLCSVQCYLFVNCTVTKKVAKVMKLHGIKQKLLKVIILPLLFLTKRRIKTTQKLCKQYSVVIQMEPLPILSQFGPQGFPIKFIYFVSTL